MTRDELERMRTEVLRNIVQTRASTERLQRMLRENAEDMERHAAMLVVLDAEIAHQQQPGEMA